MIYSNIDFTVVYVDPSTAEAGNGETPAAALADLPSTAEALADNTCYLIRRTAEDHAVTIPSGTNSDIRSILFLGMPKPGDLLYEFLPEEAKTAWALDSPDYANMQCASASGQLVLSAARQFLLHRIYLFRDGINADRYIFSLTGSDYSASVSLGNCKFGSRGIDLDHDEYTGDPVTASRMKAYFYCYYVHLLSVKNCIVNYALTGNTNDAHGIYCRYARYLDVENITVNAPASYSSSEYRALQLSDSTNLDGVECMIRNVNMKVFFNGANEYVPLLLSAYSYQNLRIDGITAAMGGALGETRPANLRLYGRMIYLYYLRDFRVENITVNLPDLWRLESNGKIFAMDDCYWGNYLPGCDKKIKNISIALASETGIGSPITYSEFQNTYDSYYAVQLEFNRNDCSNAWKMPEIDNLTITHPRGRSLYACNCRITNTSIQGSAYFYNAFADILSLQSWFPGFAVQACEGSTVRIRDLKINLENETYPYQNDPAVMSSYSNRCFVFADKSNAPLRPSVTENGTNYPPYLAFTSNNEGEDGHFIHRSPNGICDTWNVHREGGGAACLKLWNNTCNTLNTMILGQKPFKGMMLTPAQAGRYNLRLHCAWKGYPDDSDVYRRFMLSAAFNGETLWSCSAGRWLDDSASLWVNDSDLTQKVLEIPINLTEAAPIDVRMYFSWYANAGFLYVDPAVELEAVSAE